MSSSDAAREPSMDEILASIRKIIADDPADAGQAAGTDETPTEPLAGSAPADTGGTSTQGLGTRLADALRGTQDSSSAAGGVSGSIDDDLSDLLADPSSPAPASSSPPQADATANAIPDKSAEQSPTAFGRDFDPPSELRPGRDAENESPFKALGASDAMAAVFGKDRAAASASVAPSSGNDTSNVEPIRDEAARSEPVAGNGMASAGGLMGGLSASNEETEAATSDPDEEPTIVQSEASSGPVVIAAMPTKKDEPEVEEDSSRRIGFALRSVASSTGDKAPADAPLPPTSALDKLAAGLAASTGVANSPSEAGDKEPEAVSAPDAAAVTEPSVDVASSSAALPLSSSGAARTMEETVAELLRPMLREWLESNMPRIVENALRTEMGDSLKKYGGDTGTAAGSGDNVTGSGKSD